MNKMKFDAIIFNEPKLGKICCGRSPKKAEFLFVSKLNNNKLLQLTMAELEYFDTISKTINDEKIFGHTIDDGSENAEIEIHDEEKEFLYTLNGIEEINDNPGIRASLKSEFLDKGKVIEILSTTKKHF